MLQKIRGLFITIVFVSQESTVHNKQQTCVICYLGRKCELDDYCIPLYPQP